MALSCTSTFRCFVTKRGITWLGYEYMPPLTFFLNAAANSIQGSLDSNFQDFILFSKYVRIK
jgi:hypothetical protein